MRLRLSHRPQDADPGDELKQLGALLHVCDLVLTPIVDPNHAAWKLPSEKGELLPAAGYLEAYKAEAWLEYWKRGWCLVEAMIAAAYPVLNKEQRALLFRGALGNAIAAGRRPHCVFGDKEVARNGPPQFLNPLLHSTFDAHKPEEGDLTKPSRTGRRSSR